MQIVLFLCKLCCFDANYDIYHNLHCFVANDIFVAKYALLKQALLGLLSGAYYFK